jgi:Putative addiction module component
MGDAAKVLEEALKLPRSDRGRVVSELIRSLDDESSDDPASVDAAWATELQARAARARAGESGVDLGTALDRIEDKRRGR